MPKGQYNRRPKGEPREVNPEATAWGKRLNEHLVEPTGGVVIGDTVHQPLAEKTFVQPDLRQEAHDAMIAATTAAHLAAQELVVPSHSLGKPVSFDAWLDEDTSPIPANDRVSQMVQEWAAGFIPVEHSVSWLPAQDGKALSVLLTTAHGTSELVADAGTWTEADVSAALAVMRDELKV